MIKWGLTYDQDVMIGEHSIHLPNLPKEKNDILFINESYENAYWKRQTDYPQIWYEFIPYKTIADADATLRNKDTGELTHLSKKDSDVIRRLYEREIDRRENGVFFRNGNEIYYLTGSNYYTLQWCRMFGNPDNGGYGRFAKFQSDIFRLLDYMWHPKILGLYISKAKKTGITQIIDGGYFVDLATRKEEWLIGMMSVGIDKAISTNMKLFLYAFDNLPMALKPNVGFRADKGGSIDFAERGKLNSPKTNNKNVLNTKVFCVPTVEHAFDSHFMNVAHSDEFPKYFEDASKEPAEIFTNNKAGVKFQNIFRGRYILSSYPPEKDDKGSEQAAKIYMESKLSTMKHGKTESELICYHIPAHKSLFDEIDKYGNCNEKEAFRKIMEDRDRVKKDKGKYLAAVRQSPFDEKEAFGTAGASSVFDTIYLSDIEFDLEKEILESPKPPWVDGSLVWDEAIWNVGKHDKRPPGVFCNVTFRPLTEAEALDGKKGKLRQFKPIPIPDRNIPLMLGRDDMGNLLPPEKFKYFGGIDPPNYADTDDVEEASNQASYTINLHSDETNTKHRELTTKILISEYSHRPALAEEAYQDVVKEIIYFGKLCIVEANAPHTYTRLMNEGLGNYLIVKHKDGYYCRWNLGLEKSEYTGIRRTRNATQNEVLETIVEVIKHYIFKGDEGQNEYARTIKSLLLIKKLATFKVEDTKKFDEVMAFGYTLMCYDTYIASLHKHDDTHLIEETVRAMMAALEN